MLSPPRFFEFLTSGLFLLVKEPILLLKMKSFFRKNFFGIFYGQFSKIEALYLVLYYTCCYGNQTPCGVIVPRKLIT